MPKVQDIIDKRFTIYKKATDTLTGNFRFYEKAIYDSIIKEVKKLNYSENKIISDAKAQEFLLKIDKLIKDAVNNSGYVSAVKEYLTDFDKVAKNVIDASKEVNDAKINESKLKPVQSMQMTVTTDNLLGAGVNNNFVAPLREILYKNIVYGTSIEEAKAILKQNIISTEGKDSKLLRYTTQVANDGIRQYAGGMEQKIGEYIGANAVMYIGSNFTVECGTGSGRCTRAQCKRWTKMVNIPFDKLESEIQWAYNNGSGMIEGTTKDNFVINRGGYNCRHEAITVKI